jgi:hypothetical protein
MTKKPSEIWDIPSPEVRRALSTTTPTMTNTPDIEKYVADFTSEYAPFIGELFHYDTGHSAAPLMRDQEKMLTKILTTAIEEATTNYQTEYEQKHIAEALKIAKKEERQRVIDEIVEMIQSRLPDEMTEEEMEKYDCESAVLYWGKNLIINIKEIAT